MKKAFTMIELIFVIVILGILASVAIVRYFAMNQNAHENNLNSFVRTLNSTTGPDLWSRSISEGKKGSVRSYESIKKYIDIPKEIAGNDINLSKCGDGEYKTIAEANVSVVGGEYNITCKDGTPSTAPYFRLIRCKDNKVLVSRD